MMEICSLFFLKKYSDCISVAGHSKPWLLGRGRVAGCGPASQWRRLRRRPDTPARHLSPTAKSRPVQNQSMLGDDEAADLRAWLTGHGATVSGVHVATPPGRERGVLASRDLQPGDVLMRVPYAMMFSLDAVVATSRAAAAVRDLRPHLPQDELLAIALVAERRAGPESFWAPWIRTLPRSYGSTIFWSEVERQDLDGSTLHALTSMMLRQIDADFENVIAPVFQEYAEDLAAVPPTPAPGAAGEAAAAPPTTAGAAAATASLKDDYKWALGTIYSRSFDVHRRGASVRFLQPYMDMTNHCPRRGHPLSATHSFDDARDELVCTARSAVPAGSEFFFSYGSYGNAKLLYSYGFTLGSSHPVAAVDFWLRMVPPAGDPLHSKRVQALAALGCGGPDQAYKFDGTIWCRPAHLRSSGGGGGGDSCGGDEPPPSLASPPSPPDGGDDSSPFDAREVRFGARFVMMGRVQCCSEEELDVVLAAATGAASAKKQTTTIADSVAAEVDPADGITLAGRLTPRCEAAFLDTVLRLIDGRVEKWRPTSGGGGRAELLARVEVADAAAAEATAAGGDDFSAAPATTTALRRRQALEALDSEVWLLMAARERLAEMRQAMEPAASSLQ
jgi:hypothetical protein